MIHNKIQNHANVPLLPFRHQAVEILHRPVHRIDGLVVRNVVPKIHLGRRKTWRNPNRVHAQLFQIIQFRRNPLQIAHAIIVAVRETPGINFIKHRMLPPSVPLRIHALLLRVSMLASHQTKTQNEQNRRSCLSLHVFTPRLPCVTNLLWRSPCLL